MTEINATTDPQSERNLARTLGYPQSWHVVRVMPHPALLDEDDSESASNNSFIDIIYAGDPSAGVDVYYNHSAALAAALEWKNDESTGYENKGGQMLPRLPKFQKDSWVEVLYQGGDDENKKWYKAQIQKVKQYVNDIRYSVHYPEEDATQIVSEDLLRDCTDYPPSKKRKRSSTKTKSKKEQTTTATQNVKPSKEKTATQHVKPLKEKSKIATQQGKPSKEKFQKYLSTLTAEEIQSRHKMAKSMGLPSTWLAHRNDNYIFDIRSPQGVRFISKKAAFDSLLQHPPQEDEITTDKEESETEEEAVIKKTKMRRRKSKHSDIGSEEEKKLATTTPPTHNEILATLLVEDEEEGDPPFRKSGHKFLSRTVKYKHYPHGEGGIEIVQTGFVIGWLDSTDVDSNGDPAFISELTGEPGILFHVVFTADPVLAKKYKAELLLEFIDIELWELEELIDSE